MSKKETYYFEPNEVSVYLDSLAKKLHNCLFMYEDRNETAHKAISGISFQLLGLGEFLDFVRADLSFITLIYTLEQLYNEFLILDVENSHELVRSEILKCMNLINRINETLSDYMVGD